MSKEKELEKMEFSDQKEDLGKVENEKNTETKPISGWYNVKKEDLPYEGKLYNRNYRFKVKPITTETIKHYSAMDEENPLSVAEGLDHVVLNHIRVLDNNKIIPTQDVIYENDRFFFTMLVHAYSGAPTSLTFEHNCENKNCNNTQDVNITPYNLEYKELGDKAVEWISEEGGFEIKTKNFGKLNYKPLPIRKSTEIKDYIVKKQRENKLDTDKKFLEFLPLIWHKVSENSEVKDIYKKYLSDTSDQRKLSLFNRISELCDHRFTMRVKGTCEKCKRPFRTPISTLAGLRNIFFVHDIDGEFS